jgi:hypothetical protein
MCRSNVQAARKTRKSYTLSPESVAFLEKVSRARRAASVSAVLDELIESVRRAEERETLEQAVTGYYSALSDKDVKEQAQWGDFALGEFPARSITRCPLFPFLDTRCAARYGLSNCTLTRREKADVQSLSCRSMRAIATNVRTPYLWCR